MNLPALESAIKALEQSLDSLGVWLELWTALVVVGLIVEYAEDLKNLIIERPFSWKLFRTLIGGLLITAGVAGELFVQFKASAVETKLRTANHGIEALLSKETGQALERAAVAEERAAEARSMAESERLERIKLEAVVAPRSLSLDQQRLIAATCGRFSGHRVLVSSYGLDGEGAALGAQIISVLRSAGVTVLDGRATSIVTGVFELGVHVRGPDTERDFISSLGNALSSIGKLQVSINDPPPRVGGGIGGGGQAYPAGTVFVSVMVGIKPVPILAGK